MIYTKDLQRFYQDKRIWQGIPAIEKTKSGILYSAFYSGGTREGYGNFCVLTRSVDDGNTWSEPIAVAYNGEESRCFDPCLWIDPHGRLWFFWGVMPNPMVWCSVCSNPEDDNLIWSEPRSIGDGVMMNKPTVLSTGEWILPIALWSDEIYKSWMLSAVYTKKIDPPYGGMPFVYKSSDMGETFIKLGAPEVKNRSFDEHMVIEGNDGSLVMYTRTTYGISKSLSYNRGASWTNAVDSKLGGPCSRFCVRRLKSGKLILINHYKFTGRNNLTAMLSDDDGKTWYGNLLLDGRANVSYPDLIEDKDGYIYVVYDRERGCFLRTHDALVKQAREILLAKITEQDVASGEMVSDGYLCKIVSKLVGGNQNSIAAFEQIEKQNEENFAQKVLGCSTPEQILSEIYYKCGINCTSLERLTDEIDNWASKIVEEFEDKAKLAFNVKSMLSLLKNASGPNTEDVNFAVNRIFDYVKANYLVDFTLKEMANALKMSVFYMCHLFKEHTSATIISYRNSIRLASAKRMLICSDASISDVAISCGYSSVSYFSEIFKREENITPQKYRELNKKI